MRTCICKQLLSPQNKPSGWFSQHCKTMNITVIGSRGEKWSHHSSYSIGGHQSPKGGGGESCVHGVTFHPGARAEGVRAYKRESSGPQLRHYPSERRRRAACLATKPRHLHRTPNITDALIRITSESHIVIGLKTNHELNNTPPHPPDICFRFCIWDIF